MFLNPAWKHFEGMFSWRNKKICLILNCHPKYWCFYFSTKHVYSFEVSWQGASNEYSQHIFSWRYKNNFFCIPVMNYDMVKVLKFWTLYPIYFIYFILFFIIIFFAWSLLFPFYSCFLIYLTLSLPQAIILGFWKQHRSRREAHNEPSHLDLRCLTFSLSTLHIDFFPSDSSFKTKKKKQKKNKKTDDIGHLKFGTKRVNDIANSVDQWSGKRCRPWCSFWSSLIWGGTVCICYFITLIYEILGHLPYCWLYPSKKVGHWSDCRATGYSSMHSFWWPVSLQA